MPNESNTKLLLVALLAFCLGAGAFTPPIRQAARLVGLGSAADPENPTSPKAVGAELAKAKEEIVAFNTEALKYHCLDCRWAVRCTEHCREVPISEARRLGGVACKVCGGSCG